jgi:hypothetical protein
MGLPRPPGSPIALPARIGPSGAPFQRQRVRSAGRIVRTHPFAPDARARPGKTPVRTAVSPRYLIRMRSQVQVLAGPPHIPAGHSAVGSEPGAAAASVGRAGAARLSPSARPSALSGRLPGRQAPRRPRTVVAHPALVDSYAAGAATSCRQPAPVPSRRQPPALRTPAWPAWSLCGYARPPAPNPARVGHRHPDCSTRDLGSVAPRLARPSTEPPDGAAPTGTSTRPCGDGCPPHRPGRQRHHLTWDETDASGRTGADNRRLDAGRVDSRRPDPGRRPQVTGHRTDWTPDGLDSRTPGRRHRDGWTPHAGHRRSTDATAGVLAVSTTATTPDRSRAAGRCCGQTPSGRATTRTAQQQRRRGHPAATDGLATAATVSCRWYAAVQLAPWRTAVLGSDELESRAGGSRSSVMASASAGAVAV